MWQGSESAALSATSCREVCRSHYEDLNSPSKVTLQDVLNKPTTSPATITEMMATHHLVRRLLCQEGSSSSKASTIISVPTGGQVSDLKINITMKLL